MAVEETQCLMIMDFKNFENQLFDKFAQLVAIECFKGVMIGCEGHVNPLDVANGIEKRTGIKVNT